MPPAPTPKVRYKARNRSQETMEAIIDTQAWEKLATGKRSVVLRATSNPCFVHPMYRMRTPSEEIKIWQRVQLESIIRRFFEPTGLDALRVRYVFLSSFW